MTEALAGVRVIEYSRGIAGAFCSKLLADLGAEVVKIEPPEGDEVRRRGPFLKDFPGPEKSGLFLYVNTSKLGVSLNVQTAAGRNIFTELVKDVDILVVDTPAGSTKRLGMDYGALRRINPRLIVTSITPFGQTGPYRRYKAYHLNIFHAGGEGYLLPSGAGVSVPPIKMANWVGEYDAGLQAALGTLGALYYQGLSKSGQNVDVSKQEALMGLYSYHHVRYANQGVVGTRATQGQLLGGIMPCQDGYVAVIVFSEAEWTSLVKLMSKAGLNDIARFKSRNEAIKHRDEANACILEWTMSHTKDELYHEGQRGGVPIGKVSTPEDVVNSGQIKARDFMVEIDHPLAGKLKYPSAPYRFSETPVRMHPAPLLGEHNGEVYGKRLGYARQDLVRLRGAGII